MMPHIKTMNDATKSAATRHPLFRVTFTKPERVHYVRALDPDGAYQVALMIERLYEGRHRSLDRTLADAVIEVVTGEGADE